MPTTDKMLEVIKKIALAKKEAKKACNQIAAYEYEQDIKKLTDELVALYGESKDKTVMPCKKKNRRLVRPGEIGIEIRITPIVGKMWLSRFGCIPRGNETPLQLKEFLDEMLSEYLNDFKQDVLFLVEHGEEEYMKREETINRHYEDIDL